MAHDICDKSRVSCMYVISMGYFPFRLCKNESFCSKSFSTVCKMTYLIVPAHATSHLSQNLSFIHPEITQKCVIDMSS